MTHYAHVIKFALFITDPASKSMNLCCVDTTGMAGHIRAGISRGDGRIILCWVGWISTESHQFGSAAVHVKPGSVLEGMTHINQEKNRCQPSRSSVLFAADDTHGEDERSRECKSSS